MKREMSHSARERELCYSQRTAEGAEYLSKFRQSPITSTRGNQGTNMKSPHALCALQLPHAAEHSAHCNKGKRKCLKMSTPLPQINTAVHAHFCTHGHTSTYTLMHRCTHANKLTHMCTCICGHMCVYSLVHAHTCAYRCTHVHTGTCIYLYTHTRAHCLHSARSEAEISCTVAFHWHVKDRSTQCGPHAHSPTSLCDEDHSQTSQLRRSVCSAF